MASLILGFKALNLLVPWVGLIALRLDFCCCTRAKSYIVLVQWTLNQEPLTDAAAHNVIASHQRIVCRSCKEVKL
jgi:hypothetical protein